MSSDERRISLADLTMGSALLFKEIIEILEKSKLTDRSEVLNILDRGIRSSPGEANLLLLFLKNNLSAELPAENKMPPKLTVVRSEEPEA